MLGGHFIDPNGEMKDQLTRLATFSTLPESAPLFPSIVSEAGFYYPGEAGTVTCYSCGLCLNLSEAGIHPMVLHSELSPGCQCVVTHQSTATEEDAATERMSSDEVDSQAEVRDSAMLVQSVSTGITGSLAETSTAASPHGQRSLNLSRSQRRRCNRRQGNYSSLATYVGANDRSMHYRSVSPVSLQLSSVPMLNPMISYGVSDSPTDMLEINSLSCADFVNNYSPRRMMERINNNDPYLLDEMRCERCRLVTYANWPRDTNIEPEALAQAGLFYLCRADRVKCAFCYGILRNWEPSEEPMRKHRCLFPRCPFLRDPRAAGNVALGEEPPEEQTLLKTAAAGSVAADAAAAAPAAAAGAAAAPAAAAAAVPETGNAGPSSQNSALMCLVCETAERNIVFLPCSHLACCSNCARTHTACPICQSVVQRAVRTLVQEFLSIGLE